MSAKPLRALHVFPSFGHGGQQARFAELANAWGGAYEHHVVAMDGDHGAAEKVDERVDLHIHHVPPPLPGPLDVRALAVGRRVASEIAPDILCTYNWGSIEWVIANRILPVAGHVHFEDGFGPDEANGDFIQRRVLMRRAMLGENSTVVVPSRVLEKVAREIWEIPEPRVKRLPNGVDLARFSPDGPIDRRAPEGTVAVGSVGALRPEKNIARLIRIFHRASEGLDARLIIVGDGPERGALEADARTRGISEQVVFVGAVAAPERFFRGFDLFALTSDTEQMPLGLMEAMATGKTCLATDVGDVAHMLAEDNAPFVFEKTAEADMVSGLRTLLQDRDRREVIGAANRRVAERDFDRAAMAERYDRVLRDAAARTRRAK